MFRFKKAVFFSLFLHICFFSFLGHTSDILSPGKTVLHNQFSDQLGRTCFSFFQKKKYQKKRVRSICFKNEKRILAWQKKTLAFLKKRRLLPTENQLKAEVGVSPKICGCSPPDFAREIQQIKMVVPWLKGCLKEQGYWVNWGFVGSLCSARSDKCTQIEAQLVDLINLLENKTTPIPSKCQKLTLAAKRPLVFKCVDIDVTPRCGGINMNRLIGTVVCRNKPPLGKKRAPLYHFDFWCWGDGKLSTGPAPLTPIKKTPSRKK